MERAKIQRIKLMIAIFVVVVTAVFVIFRIVKYQNEGEKNMPFNVSKIIIVSTAKTEEIPSDQTEDTSLWKFNLIQNNDIHILIEENAKKNEEIKNITIKNIQTINAPKIGSLNAYMPSSLEGDKYKYINDFLITDSLTYRGADESNPKNLQISRNGGKIEFSLANTEVGQLFSNDEEAEFSSNGTILSKINLTDEDVKSKISFDIVIELSDGKKYSGNIVLDIDCNGLIENGIAQCEITDFSSVIFKRI